ncbi:polyprenyl diphosphate synthase [Streptomyces calidiresistens]|uniref:Isoprenyl transferase n=1 Tax=Streptomyces calidiresistens TaxID=1485586 RepID=A0A7W3XV94_9ACTN|nr:polyprenyl diphosphate synthase [Streptomyces calidiresistens]MBB0228578.1 di-trans,poly-cis-decaprenylcistransferase [Streptomyces calidiresistens]
MSSGSSELRESYELCAAETRQFLAGMWTVAEGTLPAAIRPHMHAITGFTTWTDRIADEGAPADRVRRIARWRSETLEDLRSGRSTHPLRRAFVDTALRWDLDRAVIEELLATFEADCASPPVFETFEDQRHYLRGVTGMWARMWIPLLDPRGPEAFRSASLLGEVGQLVDIFEDLPRDLAAGRCYLPREDLRRLGLEIADLRRGEPREALDELVDIQLTRWRDLLEQALPVTAMVGPGYEAFPAALILGAQTHFDEVTLLRSRVLAEGVEPLSLTGRARRRPARPAAGPLPGHVAVIMDGNRRWAARRGMSVAQGHRAGWRAAMRLVNSALRLGIRHLSLYMFSTENWDRSSREVQDLFDALAEAIDQGVERLHELGVRVRWCGRRDRIDPSLASRLALLENMTSNNAELTLTLCIDYGGRDEMVTAARSLAARAAAGTIRPGDIGPEDLAGSLYAPGLPDVDLLIRTAAEQRLSNFLPWQLAYAELVFDPTLWPDFDLARLRQAILDYGGRERRFGGGLPGPARPGEPARTG